VKHYSGMPYQSIAYCLDAAGLKSTELDVIALSSLSRIADLGYLFDIEAGVSEYVITRDGNMAQIGRPVPPGGLSKLPLYIRKLPVAAPTILMHVEHHLSHAASAYYTSGNAQTQLVVTADGQGDGIPLAVWRGERGRLTLLKSFPSSASLGWFYGNVTEALGWWQGDGEGKTMGLAPYGDPARVSGLLDPYCPRFAGGDLAREHDFGTPYGWNEAGAYHWHLEDSGKIRDLVEQHGAEHVAAEAQRILEEQVAALVYPWMDRIGTRNLTCAGGIFLNVKLNQRLWCSGRLGAQHIYPNPGDSGLAAGAALQAHHQLNPQAPIGDLPHLYWGPEYADDEIARVLAERNLPASFEKDIAGRVAGLLADNRIVGWLQGRMESGPRALGGRSILMSPTRAENKDVINARVKFREPFRPFCPSILAEDAPSYLENYRPERFMITSFDAAPDKRDRIPAVVHADGTVRPQTVEQKVNPLYWRLIDQFKQHTGVPVLLNTSLNIRGEPMICTPREAIRCFYDSGLDYLALGSYLLAKPGGA
ncbi:MAG: carbamoyltransferase C-terminal domain-containing protein, partial [Gammaproteobacteria bacterium]